MDWAGWALFGLATTTVLTAVTITAQLAGLTRLDLPLLHGSAVNEDPSRRVSRRFHPRHNRARLRLGYAASFALLGGLFGLLHAAVALTVLVPPLAGVHPRMASDRLELTSTAVLPPPGPLGLN